MPNWGYLAVHGTWLTALCLWLGGSVFVTFVAAPTAFALLPTRHDAGALVGEMLRRFQRLVLGCLLALAVTGGIKFAVWENPVLPVVLRYAALGLGALAALVGMYMVAPKLEALRAQMGRIDEVPEEDPRRRSFRKLHGLSMVLVLAQMLAVIGVLFLS